MKKLDFSDIKPYAITILVVVVVILVIPFVIKPQLERIREKNLEVKEGRQRLVRLDQKIEDLAKIDEVDESLKLLEVEKAVPSEKRISQLILGVSAIASESGLSVNEMSFKPGLVATASAQKSSTSEKSQKLTDQQENKNQVTFEVSLTGALRRFDDFLSRLEKAKRLMSVDSVETKRQGSNYVFNVTISAPFKALESSGDIIADPVPAFTELHQRVFSFLSQLKDYTSITIPALPTGVTNPF